MLKRNLPARLLRAGLLLVVIPVFTGCAGVGAVAELANSALEMTGLKKDKNAPVEVKLTLVAGENLNVSNGQPLSMITKIYYLKNNETFMRAPVGQLIDPAQEKAALGDSLIASREVPLMPGQRIESIEKVPPTAPYIAVAGLFFSPAPQRWKFVFRTDEARSTDLMIAAHACALTVTQGKPVPLPGMPAFDPSRLASVRCPAG